MNMVLWIAAGALAGWAAFALLGLNHTRGPWISALIGAAGGIAGGALVAPLFVSMPPGGGFSMDALVFAAVLAAAALAAGNLVHDRGGI